MKKTAFTLAEVLIALGIIGVVAALSLPVLINNTQKRELEAGLKKQYSLISQVLQKMEYENGQAVVSTDYQNVNEFKSEFMKNFKVIDDIGQKTLPYKYKTYNNIDTDFYSSYKFITSDGAMYGIFFGSPSQAVYIIVDVNGYKKPNKYGYDVFCFNQLAGSGKLVPTGAPETPWAGTIYCSKTQTNTANGLSCTYYALTDENYFKNLP